MLSIKAIAAVVGVVFFLGVGWAVNAYVAEHNRLRTENAQLIETNRHNASELVRITEQHAKTLSVLNETNLQAVARAKATGVLRKEIVDAPASDDGPVAPVLSRLLDSMRLKRARSDED